MSDATIAVDRRAASLAPRELEGFVAAAGSMPGVAVRDLDDGTQVDVRTENSVYRMTVRDRSNRRVTIAGGRLLTSPTEAWLNGSTFGGSFIKHGWIGLGMRLEVQFGPTVIVTSTIQEIATLRPAACSPRPAGPRRAPGDRWCRSAP